MHVDLPAVFEVVTSLIFNFQFFFFLFSQQGKFGKLSRERELELKRKKREKM